MKKIYEPLKLGIILVPKQDIVTASPTASGAFMFTWLGNSDETFSGGGEE